MADIRKLRAGILGVLRRGPEVVWAPEWMGIGNLLYLALWAYSANQSGGRKKVLAHARRESALSMFPMLRDELFVGRSEVRFTDRRIMPWSDSSTRNELMPGRLDEPLLAPFISELVLPGSPLMSYPAPPDSQMIVNVRRGDYYTVPMHRRAFGINTIGYVQEAVAQSVERSGRPDSFRIVSDDPEWCRKNLGPLLGEIAPTSYQANSVAGDFCTISLATRLIITNSTFSYWAGYVGDVINSSREVWAPALFSRGENGGRAYQLLPTWNVVETVPGGWDPTDE